MNVNFTRKLGVLWSLVLNEALVNVQEQAPTVRARFPGDQTTNEALQIPSHAVFLSAALVILLEDNCFSMFMLKYVTISILQLMYVMRNQMWGNTTSTLLTEA